MCLTFDQRLVLDPRRRTVALLALALHRPALLVAMEARR
jgi:hypothetical protein